MLVEDVVAVDGGGGEVFRKQLTERYEASPILRRAMVRLNWFWGVGSCVVAGGTIGIVYGLRNTNVGFALGKLVNLFLTLFRYLDWALCTNLADSF